MLRSYTSDIRLALVSFELSFNIILCIKLLVYHWKLLGVNGDKNLGKNENTDDDFN